MDLKPAKTAVREGDVVLVYVEEKPAFFARVEGFIADHKPKWWHVKLLVLNVPLHVVTWVLRLEQLNGVEPFTMGGTAIRIERVVAPPEQATAEREQATEAESSSHEETEQAEQASKDSPRASILTLGKKKKDQD